MIAALLLSHLALAQLPFATLVELPGGGEVDLSADHLSYEPGEQVITVRGHGVLRSGPLVVRADEISYRQREGRAVARGRVTVVMGLWAAVADEVEVDVHTLEANLVGGLLMQKRDVSPEALVEAETPERLRALGHSALVLKGRRIRRLGPGHFEVDGLSFTPCDCEPRVPGWWIQAAHADVEAGERAALTWPVVYVHGIPVLALPWLSLPLSSRRSGLLAPRVQATYLSGLMVEQPLFLTLGDSHDLTLAPGYAFGGSSQSLGVRGPSLQAELRYAPAEHSSGRVLLGALYDLGSPRDPLIPTELLPGRRGLRMEGVLQHAEDLGRGVRLRADLSAVSDGYYVKDLTADVLLRETQYLRSTAVLSSIDEDRYAGLEVTLRQDTRHGYLLLDPRAPNTLHRLPALGWTFLERPLWGPVSWSIAAEYSRLAPFQAGTGDEGTDGTYDPDPASLDADGTQSNRRYDPGEREARHRLDLHPRLAAQLRAGDVLRLYPYLAYRQDLYLGEATGRVAQRGYPILGVSLDTRRARTFGGGALRHTISPSLEIRSVPVVLGTPLGTYDELDDAVPTTGLWQAVAGVDQRLLLREGSRVVEVARLDLSQGYDLLTGRPGDTSARAAVRHGWLAIDAAARYSFPERRLSYLVASASFDDGKEHGARARYERITTDGSDRHRRAVDALVGPPPDQQPSQDRAELLTAGALYRFPFGLTVGYDAILQTNQPSGTGIQQTLTATYTPPCDCWRVDASASLHRAQDGRWLPGWGLRLSLTRPDLPNP